MPGGMKTSRREPDRTFEGITLPDRNLPLAVPLESRPKATWTPGDPTRTPWPLQASGRALKKLTGSILN